ncbi:hypothetical protein [Pseudomonas sp. RIT-PI-o]|uniref:hypothetical protein n=1 Tax=Pseudomonas sp. RIT-PI-o TaxID=1690246 RepID=UPI0006CCB945|nr:hypothetical protein [Pseudomonas sp. RIT-PI-o]KPG82235.1 hypothetical protein AEQ63_13615 [Pseudomonas sp. RIT-PI-o]
MRVRSMLLNDHMVRAVLQGRKTVARFAVEGAAAKWLIDQSPEWVAARANELCVYGQPGDRLWVRENTEAQLSPCGAVILSRYAADKAPVLYSGCDDPEFNGSVAHWDYSKNVRPGSRMQKWARRILLEVTAVGIERLQSISDDQCVAEGIIPVPKINPANEHERQFWRDYHLSGDGSSCVHTARESFKTLWRHNNGWSFPKGATLETSAPNRWDANPWVWVVEFRRIEKGQSATCRVAA